MFVAANSCCFCRSVFPEVSVLRAMSTHSPPIRIRLRPTLSPASMYRDPGSVRSNITEPLGLALIGQSARAALPRLVFPIVRTVRPG
jgi:hypothetical protein